MGDYVFTVPAIQCSADINYRTGCKLAFRKILAAAQALPASFTLRLNFFSLCS